MKKAMTKTEDRMGIEILQTNMHSLSFSLWTALSSALAPDFVTNEFATLAVWAGDFELSNSFVVKITNTTIGITSP